MATEPGRWRHLWCKIVRGARFDKHCAQCLKGPAVREINPKMSSVDMDLRAERGEYLYICGVSHDYSPRRPESYTSNLHVVLGAGGDSFELKTAVTSIDVVGCSVFTIPSLPDGFNGLDERFTRCRNYQFAVAAFAPTQLSML